MTDPIRGLTNWLQNLGLLRLKKSKTELIEHRDAVDYASGLIRNYELRLWFERDWRTAGQIAERTPECLIFSIPDGAYWIDELNVPPPWRQPRHDNSAV